MIQLGWCTDLSRDETRGHGGGAASMKHETERGYEYGRVESVINFTFSPAFVLAVTTGNEGRKIKKSENAI